MPDPFERHGKSDSWGPQPSRSQLRRRAAVDEAEKKAPGKKDPALCKAAHWKAPHGRELRLRRFGWPASRSCGWGLPWVGDEAAWLCGHEEFCPGCGKVLRNHVEPGECPAWHAATAEDLAAVESERARRDDLAAARAARKPVIDGPQGYRRKRSA